MSISNHQRAPLSDDAMRGELAMEKSMHLTPRQLAQRWQLSEKTLERWRTQGTGPIFMKLVGRVLYPLKHIEALEAKRIRQATNKSLPAGTDLTAVDNVMAAR